MFAFLDGLGVAFFSLLAWLAGVAPYLAALVVLIGAALILLSLVEDDPPGVEGRIDPRDYDW